MSVSYGELIDQELSGEEVQAPVNNEVGYAEILDQEESGLEQNIATSFYAAEKTNPDHAAEVLKLSKELDLPSDLVERNYDKLKGEREMAVKVEPRQVISTNPALARFLEDVDNAKLAKDDIDSLNKAKDALSSSSYAEEAVKAFKYGANRLASGLAKIPALAYTPNYGPGFLYEGASGEQYRQEERADYKGIPRSLYDNSVTQALDEKAKEFQVDALSKSFTTELSKGNTAGAFRALSLQIISNLPQLGALAVAGPAALPAMGAAASAEKLGENLEAGIPEELAKSNALLTGSIEAGIEAIGGVGSVGFKETIKQAAEVLGTEGAKEMIKRSLGTILKTGGAEGAEEFATTLSQSILDYGTGVDDKALDGLMTKSIDSFFVGAGSGMTIGSGSIAAEKGLQIFQTSNKAEASKEAFIALNEAAKESKLNKRMPEKFAEYVDGLADDSGLKDVYIPVEDFKTFFQSKQISPVEIANQLGAAKEFNEAVETGADIRVPLSKVIQTLGSQDYYNELADNIKFQPDVQTVAQVKKELKAFRDELGKVEQQAVQEAGPIGIDFAASNKEISRIVSEQLKALGDTGKEARQKSQLAVSFFDSLGRRTNQDPLELFKKYNLRITGQESSDFDPMQMAAQGEKVFAQDKSGNDIAQARFKIKDGELIPDDGDGAYEAVTVDASYRRKGIATELYRMAAEAVGKPVSNLGGQTDAGKAFREAIKDDRIFFQSGISNKQKAEAAGFDTSRKMYHGGPVGIAAFRTNPKGANKYLEGVYMTTSKNEASRYADMVKGSDKTIYELYAPKDLLDLDSDQSVNDAILKMGLEIPKLRNENQWRFNPEMKSLMKLRRAIEKSGVKGKQIDTVLRQKLIESGFKGLKTDNDLVTVVFDPKDVRSVNAKFEDLESDLILAQSDEFANMRGSIRFGSAEVTIQMLANADRSTYFHEMGHFYLEVLADQATAENAPQNLKDDWQTILNFLGVQSREEIKTEHHEKWAESFEKYLQEGKAPNQKLRRAFAAFKAWITEAYKGLVKSSVELSDDIRQVMDRMLAAELVIEQAEADMDSVESFFKTKPEGMSDDKWVKYQEMFAEAREAGKEFIRKKLFEDIRKRDQAFYKSKANEIKQEVEKELQQARSYKALSILQKGELPDGSPLAEELRNLKIDPASLKQMDQEQVKNLPSGIRSKETGVHVEIVAELLGYGNGSQMIEALANLKKFDVAVEETVEQKMQELYPDYLTDPVISQDAIEAVHNERKSDVIREELIFIAENYSAQFNDVVKKLARKLPSSEVVKEQARKILAGKLVKDLNPNIYKNAEKKARKEAGEALAKLDASKLFQAKRRELLNFELYRVAVEAKEMVDKSLASYKKVLRKSEEDIAKTRDVDFVNAGRAILAEFGIHRSTEKTADEYLSKLKEYDLEKYNGIKSQLIDPVIALRGNYKEVTFDTFVMMDESVQALFDVAAEEKKFEVDGETLQREAVQKELEDRLLELSEGGVKNKFWGEQTTGEAIKQGLLSFRAVLTRVEHWAGVADGAKKEFTKYLWNPISDARSKYRLEKTKVIAKYRDIAKMLDKSSLFNGPIKSPELGSTQFANKFELLGAMLHTGNESNMQKLLLGRNWAELREDGTLNTRRWDAFVNRMQKEGILTKKDYDWMQAIWDLNESLKPEAQKAHKKMYGFYFNEITHKEFETPYGTYRGGYVPAAVDSTKSEAGAIRAEKELLETGQNSFMFPTTGRGFTKSRVENYNDQLNINPTFIEQHLDKVLRFIHLEPKVKQAARIVNDKNFRARLAEYDPEVGSGMLVPWLQRAASQRVSNPTGTGRAWQLADKFFNALRNRTGMQIMAANTINVLQNYTGIIVSASKVKPSLIRNSVFSYVTNSKAMSDLAASKSQFMEGVLKDQMQDIQSEIRDIYSEDTNLKQIRQWAQDNAYVLQKISQNQNNVIVWNAAYNEAVENKMLEKEAIRYADAAVRLTQGSMEATDISRFEAGNPFTRLFTQFYSYFNNIANLQSAEIQKIVRELGFRRGAGKLFVLTMTTLYLPAITAEVIRRLASGQGLDADDDDEYMDDYMAILFGAPASYLFAELPFAGPTAQLVSNQFNQKHYDDRLNVSPVVGTIESMAKLPRDVYNAVDEKDLDNRFIRDSLTFIGVLTGTPAGALSRPLTYLNDIRRDEVEPEGIFDFTRGLVTGKGGQ